MKKVFLAILIFVLCATPLLFTGCSNVSQRELLSTSYVGGDNGYELFTYDVYQQVNGTFTDKDGNYLKKVGVMTMKFMCVDSTDDNILPAVIDSPVYKKKADKEEVVVLSKEVIDGKIHAKVTNYTGAYLLMNLTIDDTDTIESHVIYDNACNPLYSYKRTVIGGVTKEMEVRYEEKYLYGVRKEGDKETSFKHKSSGCYDNEELYAIIRASVLEESSYNLSYTCVNPLTGNADGITISKSAIEPKVIPLFSTENTNVYPFTISTDNQYAKSYSMEIVRSVSVIATKIDNPQVTEKVNLKKIISLITEGEYEYCLSAFAVFR